MKYRIKQEDYRDNKTGAPVPQYYIEYFSVGRIWSVWIEYSYPVGKVPGSKITYYDTPKFSTLKKAKKYLRNLKQPLINKVTI